MRIRAVDFDGTLAFYDGSKGPLHLGAPVPRMVAQIKRWLAQGDQVVIFTARVQNHDAAGIRPLIEAWSKRHIGQVLEVTNEKRHEFSDFYDDRAWRVEKNTGRIVGEKVSLRR